MVYCTSFWNDGRVSEVRVYRISFPMTKSFCAFSFAKAAGTLFTFCKYQWHLFTKTWATLWSEFIEVLGFHYHYEKFKASFILTDFVFYLPKQFDWVKLFGQLSLPSLRSMKHLRVWQDDFINAVSSNSYLVL